MPFDGKDYTSAEGLVAWLETKDPAETYRPRCGVNCVLCQWLTALNNEPVVYYSEGVYEARETGREIDMRHLEFVVTGRSHCHDYSAPIQTFGAALARARELLAGQR